MAGVVKAAAASNMPKISLDEYGDPPEPPGVEEIIDDIKRATLDDIVFKSSNAVEKIYNTNRNNDSNLLQDDESVITMPDKDQRKDLTPKQAYEMSLKFVERNEKLNLLLTMLKDRSEKLNSLKEEMVKCLKQNDDD